MCNDFIDRSITSVEEWKKSGDEIFALKRQTRFAIEEATARNLLMQAKLRESLKVVEPNDIKTIQVMKALCDLQGNWDELNELYEEVTWRLPMRWDEDYEAMENLIALVQKIKGKR